MLQLAADENFNNDILRGLKRRDPLLDIVRIQDAGLSGATDPELLIGIVHGGPPDLAENHDHYRYGTPQKG